MRAPATMKVKIKPFMVPEFAQIDLSGPWHDDEETASIPVAELDIEALDVLADQWLDDLYASAKKPNPFAIIRSAA